MKKISLVIAAALLLPGLNVILHAQDADANVLSYYAMGNSLDGRPMVDMQNLLRFYPVFALRDYTDSVRVTIYYGPHIYSRKADRYDEGRYWQVQLPQFRIGEAIQRIDVETWMDMKRHPLYQRYLRNLDAIGVDIAMVRKQLNAIPDEIAKVRLDGKSVDSAASILNSDFSIAITGKLPAMLNPTIDLVEKVTRRSLQGIDSLFGLIPTICDTGANSDPLAKCREAQARVADAKALVKHYLGEMEVTLKNVAVSKKDSIVNQFRQLFAERLGQRGLEYNAYLDRGMSEVFTTRLHSFDSTILRYVSVMDSIRDRLAALSVELSDTSYAGPGVRRGDVTLDTSMTARILYRNYKPGLRSLPALDPAERLGVFRARYVPFVIRNRQLETPFTASDGAVFEVGLGFSDVALTGDEFVQPELSISRLGVAFAVTRKLFDKSADIRALVLTYDFNAYGSIGVGANFPGTGNMESYLSFGINKQAFEALLGGISKLFGPGS